MNPGKTWTIERRAAVHAALGDSTRLRIVDALTTGDLSSSELSAQLSVPTNLLAHHVQTLERAGLVRRVRSEGDRRRGYLQLIPGFADQLLIGRSVAAARVVFVCSRNTARSQLAAAAWAQHSRIPATSAGTHPADHVHPGALAAARRHGIAIRPRAPQGMDGLLRNGDIVIAVCDNAHEELDSSMTRLHWSIPDPVPMGAEAAFDRALEDILDRIDRIAPTIAAESTDEPPA
ncbi:helix-turn-helix domain-containing protein [Nocardia sp. NRRL WC-3656]|uniref:arsenate reductase/protein-tyrosine-phosphatase family protein n=1 Tax=Nocardia sp. NRRL WC-3656 TaxID=1463824 RepID=UPI0004C3BAAF|nr:helix-turn-helix domain-containing protein [Nocardia sp. NRRL WC-3656]